MVIVLEELIESVIKSIQNTYQHQLKTIIIIHHHYVGRPVDHHYVGRPRATKNFL